MASPTAGKSPSPAYEEVRWLPTDELKVRDEWRDAVPRPDEADRQRLRDSIKKHGVREPIIANPSGRVLDGHTRLEIAVELGIAKVPVMVRKLNGQAAVNYAVIANLARRQLAPYQKLELAAKAGMIDKAKAAVKRAKAAGKPAGRVADRLAVQLDVSPDSVKRATTVMKRGDEEIKEQVRAGRKSLKKAAAEVRAKAARHKAKKKDETRPLDAPAPDVAVVDLRHVKLAEIGSPQIDLQLVPPVYRRRKFTNKEFAARLKNAGSVVVCIVAPRDVTSCASALRYIWHGIRQTTAPRVYMGEAALYGDPTIQEEHAYVVPCWIGPPTMNDPPEHAMPPKDHLVLATYDSLLAAIEQWYPKQRYMCVGWNAAPDEKLSGRWEFVGCAPPSVEPYHGEPLAEEDGSSPGRLASGSVSRMHEDALVNELADEAAGEGPRRPPIASLDDVSYDELKDANAVLREAWPTALIQIMHSGQPSDASLAALHEAGQRAAKKKSAKKIPSVHDLVGIARAHAIEGDGSTERRSAVEPAAVVLSAAVRGWIDSGCDLADSPVVREMLAAADDYTTRNVRLSAADVMAAAWHASRERKASIEWAEANPPDKAKPKAKSKKAAPSDWEQYTAAQWLLEELDGPSLAILFGAEAPPEDNDVVVNTIAFMTTVEDVGGHDAESIALAAAAHRRVHPAECVPERDRARQAALRLPVWIHDVIEAGNGLAHPDVAATLLEAANNISSHDVRITAADVLHAARENSKGRKALDKMNAPKRKRAPKKTSGHPKI